MVVVYNLYACVHERVVDGMESTPTCFNKLNSIEFGIGTRGYWRSILVALKSKYCS